MAILGRTIRCCLTKTSPALRPLPFGCRVPLQQQMWGPPALQPAWLSLRQPARAVEPNGGQDVSPHEQAQVAARRDCFRNGAMTVINKVLQRKYLLQCDNIVVPRGEQKHWTAQPGEIDASAQRDERSGGQTVLLEYLF